MKKLITIILIFFYNYPQAQIKPFAAAYYHNKGYSLQGGVKYDNWAGLIGYSKPFNSAIIPTLFFANIGYEIPLSEKKGYNITPLIGVSSYSYLYKELPIKGIALITAIEIGKDINTGRLFVSGNYCKGFFFGGGIKIFIN
jgi:hypothetical protein